MHKLDSGYLNNASGDVNSVGYVFMTNIILKPVTLSKCWTHKYRDSHEKSVKSHVIISLKKLKIPIPT